MAFRSVATDVMSPQFVSVRGQVGSRASSPSRRASGSSPARFRGANAVTERDQMRILRAIGAERLHDQQHGMAEFLLLRRDPAIRSERRSPADIPNVGCGVRFAASQSGIGTR